MKSWVGCAPTAQGGIELCPANSYLDVRTYHYTMDVMVDLRYLLLLKLLPNHFRLLAIYITRRWRENGRVGAAPNRRCDC